MAESTRLAREEVDVLANAAEVRIIILGNERDPERPRPQSRTRSSGDTSRRTRRDRSP